MPGKNGVGRNSSSASVTAVGKRQARSLSGAAKSAVGGLHAWFPKLSNPKKRFGIGITLALVKREGGAADLRYVTLEEAFETPGKRPKAALLAKANAKKVAALMAGLSHPDRYRVASAIMTGSNSHRLLKESVGLKTGPLYHHVRGLQMAGLVTQPSRNFYTLTEIGEAALLFATSLGTKVAQPGSTWKTHTICIVHKNGKARK